MTTTLTDRYVWAVLRAVPGSQRAELEPEVRALVADAIEARAARGDLAEDAVERAALEELGDPNVLAAQYAGGPQYLIGPLVFPEWRRLVTLLVSILVPIIAVVVLSASLLSGSTVGQAIVSAGGSAFMVALQTVFWITLVFAVIERMAGQTLSSRTWSPDALPELPDRGQISVAETCAALAFNVLVLAALLWVQLQPPITVEGETYPLFDPALWSFWLPWFIGVLVLEVVHSALLLVRGRWNWAFAVFNALLGAAFAIPAVYLIQNQMLINPALVQAVNAATGGEGLPVTGLITSIAIIVIVLWDAVDGFRKARRAGNPATSG